jgi:hypothetical protein
MTRAELKQRIRVLGGHLFNTGFDQDPFGLDVLLIEQANQIARSTDCLVGRRYMDLVAGEDEYCSPDIYKIRGIYYLDGSDYQRVRQIIFSSKQFDDNRNDSTSTYPDIAAIYGMNRIRLKPAPSTAVSSGLMVEGYCQPGNIWQYNSSGTVLCRLLHMTAWFTRFSMHVPCKCVMQPESNCTSRNTNAD